MINVTRTFLPSQEEYQEILSTVWETKWITNRGVLVKKLENLISNYLECSMPILMTNGTLPLQIALKGFEIKGEVITTPFSYIATTSSILWEGCSPVFVDIDPRYLSIDEELIVDKITDKTEAILVTHVFGNPCNIEVLQAISNKYGLKLIFDAAHCFGVKYKNKSIFEYGDVSTCSFHATKLFHTGEGGALFCKPELRDLFYYRHNFGHIDSENFLCVGINAKMSELQAALGLAMLPYISNLIAERKSLHDYYINNLTIDFAFEIRAETIWNYAYFPVLFEDESRLLRAISSLNKNDIYPRRYFYPSLESVSVISNQHKSCPISNDVSKRILCLPFYNGLEKKDILKICNLINEL